MVENKSKKTINRRQFLKRAGAGSAVLGGAGMGFFGLSIWQRSGIIYRMGNTRRGSTIF